MSQTFRFGIIGCGGNARGHGRRLAQLPEVEIVALNDVSEAALANYQETVPGTADLPTFPDYQALLEAVELDAVCISTPHTTHYDQIMDALSQGLHVLTEKPMVCTVEHARNIIAKQQETGLHVMVSYQRHFLPIYVYCYDVVQSGRYGKPLFVAANQCQNWRRGTAGAWRQDPALSGGGQLNDSGSHLLDIVLWITGQKATQVTALIDNRGTPVDILSALAVRLEEGALINFSIVGDAIGRMREDISIWCEKGTLFLRDGKLFREEPDADITEVLEDELPAGNSPDEAFIDLLCGRAENRVSPACALRVIELTEAAWKAAETGDSVEVQ